MIKSNTKKCFLVLLPLLTLFFISGCGTTIKHLSPEEFITQAKQINGMNSATWTTYIGVTASRVYLEYGDAFGLNSKTRTIVYWTELAGLPHDLRQKLKEGGSPPCTPLQEDEKAKGKKYNLLQRNPWEQPVQR
ncbi:MAG: hypothetical protein PHN84_07895 [Desulfuromonadaceae bacterium]|nr:hypothetical protein [Desulfuromonadaceae bacterium]MDD2854753.1 hypothetical protein [Desulfuromonadaceae bacterium]